MAILQPEATPQVEFLGEAILERLKGTKNGHCARVDFLERAEVLAVSCYLAQRSLESGDIDLAVHILVASEMQAQRDPLFITTDRAIEMRNRKQGRLCLFVPSDIKDAAYSSIANSFAQIDSRGLYTAVLKRVQEQLAQLSSDAGSVVHTVFAHLRGIPGDSSERRLDFAVAALKRAQAGEITRIGLELWRVGLIADASDAFASKLDGNRNCAKTLARPAKLDATARERIGNLKVDQDTATKLGIFFRGRGMNDVHSWSQALFDADLTFDGWVFPQTDRSNIRSVKFKPFLNAKGEVERYCHLAQPDGPGCGLYARYGAKEKLIVRWKCNPEKPTDLHSWHIGIVPAGSEGFNDCLEERYVPGHRGSVTLKIDMEFDEPPDYAVCVRIVPLNVDGSEIRGEENQVIGDMSDEFFLVQDAAIPKPPASKERRQAVPTLAFGRLEVASEVRETVLEESQPRWQSKDLEYFSLHIQEGRRINIGLSSTLLQLEKKSIGEPRKGGSFVLSTDYVRPIGVEEIREHLLSTGEREVWGNFWRQRELFFKRLKQSESEGRGVVEVVDWTPELAGAALRYAQAYRELIDDLVHVHADAGELLAALSVDTLLVRVTHYGQKVEEALVILPTHPLRVAWFASYTQLLRAWEEELLDIPRQKRKQNVDLQALRLLVPTNVPAFAYHSATPTTFTFFQNLLFFHGIALPADVPDPHRRYGDIATLLNAGIDQVGIGDIQPNQLAEHLRAFQELHPYVDTIVTTLVNPDRGNFFAEAVRELLPAGTDSSDETGVVTPMFQITSYTEDKHTTTAQAFGQILQQPIGQSYRRTTDHFLPGLVTTSRHMSQLAQSSEPPEAHLAIITDLTRPTIVASLTGPAAPASADISSFSFYGLINRFISQFSANEEGLLWQHHIVTEGMRKPEPHPAGPRYTEMLIELHTSLLNAGGYLLNNTAETRPVLEVRLNAERRKLLERLHEKTNWVITLDRFFTLDYYDSPNEPGLDEVARKYVLDYSPEFTEGLGHRMMVTTAWHEEISSLLSQAMDELGFASIDQSVGHLLHYLKTISGRLALQALESPSNAAAAVGLGVVTAWLQSRGRLKQAVLVPVDAYPRLFSLDGSGKSVPGSKRCDLVLISLRRNIVDATFIEVKWRRGRAPLETLAENMVQQMKASEYALRKRFFNEEQIDGALQRSYLANVLRFYFERSRRYKLFDTAAENTFLEHVARLEKTRLDFKASYEGYVVSLESEKRDRPLQIENARITLLTAKDFASTPQFFSESDIEPEETPRTTRHLGDDHVVDGAEDEMEAMAPTVPLLDERQSIPLEADTQQKQLPAEEVIIPLGTALGGPVDWRPSVKGSPHLFILGIPGQGKSWTITRLLTELGKQHVPSLVLDFHGQFADREGSFARTIQPTVLDAAKGLPFSPFECTPGNIAGDWKANALAVAEIFAYVTNLGDMQRDVVFTAIRDVYRARGFDDGLTDEEIKGLEYPTLAEVFRRIEQKEQSRHVSNVTARCRPLLEMDLFRPLPHAPDLLSLVRNGLVIDLHTLFAETLQLAAGAFVLRKLYKDMFHWGQADRLRLAIVLDEAHRLAKDITLPKIMKEGRKFGIAVIVASQGLGDFHPDIVNNVGTKVIFRLNFPESKRSAGFIRVAQGQDLAARIEQLAVGSAYIQTPEMSQGSVVHMYSL